MGGIAGVFGSIFLTRGILILSFAKLALSFVGGGPQQHAAANIRSNPRQFLLELAGPIFLLVSARCWFVVVSLFVPEPYLDEVFHIPQAQTYCEGRYYDWDNKITTPPGLYVLTILFNRGQGINACTPQTLRSFNVYAISLLGFLASECRSLIEAQNSSAGRGGTKPRDDDAQKRRPSPYSLHTGLNIALFPILFFFSGLYYTDIASTLAVLLCYRVHLGRTAQPQPPSVLSDAFVVAAGLLALTMRQTNVFWVVVFMGGMEVVHAVKTLKPRKAVDGRDVGRGRGGGPKDVFLWYIQRYMEGDIHDPPVNLAWPDDTIITLASLGIAATFNPLRVLRQIWPYLAVLLSFGGFVAWNGGVVLGDKSNHVATIHLAQMLYIWPFFLFFSIPLCLSFGFHFAGRVLTYFGTLRQRQNISSSPGKTSSSDPPSARKRGAATRYVKPKGPSSPNNPLPGGTGSAHLDSILLRKSYVPFFSAVLLMLLGLVVKFNTIIHPFTLADNRHYMFYVFRYSIRQSWWIRYLLIFPYRTAIVNVRRCLAGCQPVYKTHGADCPVEMQKSGGVRFLNSPFMDAGMREMRASVEEGEPKSTTTTTTAKTIQAENAQDLSLIPPATSTEAIWLLATALSLVTAPLVEPRYFILPWVFWRLHVPEWRVHDCSPPSAVDSSSGDSSATQFTSWLENMDDIVGPTVTRLGRKLDLRLFVETAWFLLVNAATIYVFVARPFFWYDGEGNVVDEGRVQRFMW